MIRFIAALLMSSFTMMAAVPAAASTSRGFAEVVAKDLPGVVSIFTTRVEKAAYSEPGSPVTPGSPRRKHKSAGEGSGVIVAPDGLPQAPRFVERAPRIVGQMGGDLQAHIAVAPLRPGIDRLQ